MLQHNIIDVLKTFSEEEIKGFRKFLESPYFNTSQLALKLYDELVKFYPGFDNPALTKESLYTELGTENDYNDSTMRNLLADLVRLAEKFLKQQNFENTRYGTYIHLLDELVKRGLTELFRRNEIIIESVMEEAPKIDGNYFLGRYQFEANRFDMGMIYNITSGGSQVNSNINTLTETGKFLISYFVSELLKVNDNLVKLSRINNIEIKDNKLKKLVNSIDFKNLIGKLNEFYGKEYPIFNMYYNLYRAFSYLEDDAYYFKYKKQLLECSDMLSNDEKHYLYIRLLDYCQIKSNLGNEFDKELFEILNIVLMYEYYKTGTNIYIPTALYRNALMLALSMKEYKWLDFFVKSYLNKVEPSQQENLYHYSYANLYFANGDYPKSLEHLMNVDYDYFVFKLDMKSLLLRIYYELNYYESAYSLMDCYNHILRRSKLVNPLRKATHGNFVLYVQKLLKLKFNPDQDEARLLKKQIAGNKEVLNKEWLLEKADELNKKYRRAV